MWTLSRFADEISADFRTKAREACTDILTNEGAAFA
jgi:hypothetical protein